MKVCIVSQEFPPESAHGGIGTQSWNKARQLIKRGHEVHVLSCAGAKIADRESGLLTRKDGLLTVHRVSTPALDPMGKLEIHTQPVWTFGYAWQVFRALQRILEQNTFDIINFPEYEAEGLFYLLNRTQWNWIPSIVQLHGPLCLFAKTLGWPAEDDPAYRAGVYTEGECIRLADGLMASSANIADFSSDFFGVERETIQVVHCGIDVQQFKPPQRTQGDRPPTILFVGNIVVSKGAMQVFDAALKLRAKYPNLRLRLIGKDEELIGKMERLAAKAGHADLVDYVGFVRDRAAMPQYFAEADVFASPASHEPGVANVYVEAMACGCPVVAADSGGAPEAVIDNVTGIIVPPKDGDATTEAIDRILSDPQLAARLGAGGREKVENYFATEHYIERILRAYESTIENSRRKYRDLFGTDLKVGSAG